jgi:hypothetical protein
MRTRPFSPLRESFTPKSPHRHRFLSAESRSLIFAVGLPIHGLLAENWVFHPGESQTIPPATSSPEPNVPSPHVVAPREIVPPFPVSLVVKTTFAGIVELFVMHRRTPRFEDCLSVSVADAASVAGDELDDEHEVAVRAARIANTPSAVE